MEVNVQLRDEDAEKLVLGTIIPDLKALEDVPDLFSEEAVYNPFHQQV